LTNPLIHIGFSCIAFIYSPLNQLTQPAPQAPAICSSMALSLGCT
jgi:hypothetical protein